MSICNQKGRLFLHLAVSDWNIPTILYANAPALQAVNALPAALSAKSSYAKCRSSTVYATTIAQQTLSSKMCATVFTRAAAELCNCKMCGLTILMGLPDAASFAVCAVVPCVCTMQGKGTIGAANQVPYAAPVAMQETNPGMIKQLSYLLTDILNTGTIDYLTDDNTAVVDEHQLPPITPGNPNPGRKLLSRLEADEVCPRPAPACA